MMATESRKQREDSGQQHKLWKKQIKQIHVYCANRDTKRFFNLGLMVGNSLQMKNI